MSDTTNTAQTTSEQKENTSSTDKTCKFIKRNFRKRKTDDFVAEDETPSMLAPKSKAEARGVELSTKDLKPQHENFTWNSTTEMVASRDTKATSVNEEETERDLDARGIEERAKKLQQLAESDKEAIYRGQKAYKTYIGEEDKSGLVKGTGIKAGPIRTSIFSRKASHVDYNPYVCKDYKETGMCGFGDSCIYVHDRGDYKMGWELDKEWEEQIEAQKKAEKNQGEEKPKDELDDVPFACFVCREPFDEPVKTPCKHYFCLKCVKKSERCPVCEHPTGLKFVFVRGAEKDKLERSAKRHHQQLEAAKEEPAES